MRLRNKLINAEKELERTITYFGKLIFLIKSPLETIEETLALVTSTKKFHRTTPSKRYIA